jgi:hypothetical protein
LDEDAYIKHFLALPVFLLTGTDLKVFSHLGDRVAGSIARVTSINGPMSDDMLQRVLLAVKASLKYATGITRPTQSIQLLETLLNATNSDLQRGAIAAAIQELKKN